jgi:hypothetical protein
MTFFVYDPEVGFLSDIRHVSLNDNPNNTKSNSNNSHNNLNLNLHRTEPPSTSRRRTQASRLPQCFNYTLDAIEQLEGWQNYETWAIYVEAQLRLYGLEDLINSNISRPAPSDPKFDLWKKHSLRVKNWLFLQLSPDIISEILFSHSLDPPDTHGRSQSDRGGDYKQYGDEMWNAIRAITVGDEFYDTTVEHSRWVNSVHWHHVAYSAWMKALNTKRENFPTIDQFVSALKRRVHESNRLTMLITPYQATCLLLHELRNELPSWTVTVQISFKDNVAAALKERDFWDLCRMAQNQARILQDDQPVTRIPR